MLAKKLHYGDTIGVIGVSSSLESDKNGHEIFTKAEKVFTEHGFRVKKGKYVFENYYGAAGTKEQKAEDMMEMFCDPEVKAIVCLTGGDTCNTFLDLLDYEVIKKNPKIFTGFSDISVLLQTIYQKTGLVTFHGSAFKNFGKQFSEENYQEFENVFLRKKVAKFENGEKKVIRAGNACGKTIGTNLPRMLSIIGTEYFPDMQDKLLFLECYHTTINQCQSRIAQLRQCGVFDRVNGVVIGYNYDLQKNGDIYPQLEDILLDYTKEYNFPIIKCNDFGHEIANAVIPIGVEARIDSDHAKVEITGEFLLD